MKISRIPFAFVLPVLALGATVALIGIQCAEVYYNLHTRGVGGFVRLGPSYRMPANAILGESLRFSLASLSHIIQALHIPAFSVEVIVDHLTGAWPSTATPHGLDFLTWRALIFPIYCLPFWWFAGLGFDALTGRRSRRWPVLLSGAVLSGFCVFLFLGLRFALSAEEREGIVYPLWGFALWAALFAVFPAAWIRAFRTTV